VAFGPDLLPDERPRSAYDQLIKPHEDRIVWYNLREKLPEVAPDIKPADPRPPRAVKPFDQNLVVGEKELERPPQMISVPAPEIAEPKLAPLPNVVAASRPSRAVRAFVPPPEKAAPAASKLTLPDAPRVTDVAVALAPPVTATPRAPLRPFTPPPQKPAPASPSLALPDAPQVAASLDVKAPPMGGGAPRPQPRAFTPPPGTAPTRNGAASLPAAPDVAAGVPSATTSAFDKMPRPFVTPLDRRAAAAPSPATLSDDAPPLNPVPGLGDGDGDSVMAIVGLNPSKTVDFPMPSNAQQAGFSAGPQKRLEGSSGGTTGAAIVVPGLLAQGGVKDAQPTLVASIAPTSRENLAAAARLAMHAPPPPAGHIPPAEPRATRVSSAPDPRLDGRIIYTIAIQMPNVTSYSGSWIVWFAEHETLPGAAAADIRPPLPLRKVDPKYIAAAADERVEGKVRLSAIIRKDGHVDTVSLLQHLDERLDRSAEEALAKWEFSPAHRNGAPVEVDAVFEIPFRLAPRPIK
jgi:TonB family protein